MRIPKKPRKLSPLGKRGKATVRKYELSASRLILIVFGALLAGGLIILSDIPGYLKANYVVLTHPEAVPSFFASNNFDEVRLDIKFKHFRRIQEKRQEAMKRGLLISSDADYVPAQIRVGGKTVNCKLRLKGDLSDHWESEKWSFRVRLKGDANIYGMTSFSLQHPITRGNTSEWLYLNSLKNEDLLAVRYHFVNLTINGKKMGIYAMEEHFSTALMETNNKREGIIVSFDEYRYWKNLPPRQNNIDWPSAYQSADIQERNSNRIEKSPELRKQKVLALNLLRHLQEKKLEGTDVFSPDRLGRFLAMSRLWNAEHGLLFQNVNFYFDPITNRLEPIGYDGFPGAKITAPNCYFSGGWIADNWVNQALRSPRIAKAYIKHLELVTRPTFIKVLKEQFEEEELKLRRILFREILFEDDRLIWKSDSSLLNYTPWRVLTERAKAIRKELNEERPAIVYARPAKGNSSDLEIVVRNALTQPIEIIGFEKGDHSWSAKEALISPSITQLDPTRKNIVMPLQRFGHTSLDGDHLFILASYFNQNSNQDAKPTSGKLNLIVRILGMDLKVHHLPVPIDPYRFKPEKLPFRTNHDNNVSDYSFLHEKGDTIFVIPGEHNVTEDLIIPPHRSLEIPAGTTLRFGNGATLVSESPIRARGTEQNPITLTAAQEGWSGLLVANASEPSFLKHVRISKMGRTDKNTNYPGINRGNWTLTGGITFYHSPIEISHCLINDVSTEDALNIISSDFNVTDSIFSDVSSDAFDGDFVRGGITNCTFEHIGGDAIDLSGSNTSIDNVRVFYAKDKAISAGEDTRSTISRSILKNVGFGIASKDLSDVLALDVQIHKASIAALAAYQKKSLFGPSAITVRGIKVTGTSNLHLIQKGSSATIDGERIEGSELDVKLLYQEQPSPQ
tara:strand:+ start:311 stop:3025 length:2715 start_codon:yes stop_codon:yes gene_type:complete